MRYGDYFRLNIATFAVDHSGSKPAAIKVPEGAIIHVPASQYPNDPRMIEVEWRSSRLVMFAVDFQERAEKISESVKGA